MASRVGRASAVLLLFFTLIALGGCGSGSPVCPAASGLLCGCGAAAAACPIPAPHLYADGITGEVSVFSVDRATGMLGTPTSVSGPLNSLGMAALNDQFLFVSDLGPGGTAAIDVWSINQSTGELTPGPPFSMGPLSIAAGLAVNFNNQVLYVADAGKIDALKANTTTGALAPISGSPFPSNGSLYLTLDPSDHFLFASAGDPPGGVAAFTLDSAGALTPVPGSPFAADPNATVMPGPIGVDSSGKFVYITLVQSGQIAGFSIAPNGALTPVPQSPFPTGNTPLVLATMRQFVYVSNLGDRTVSGFTIDSTTGSLTPIAGSPFPIPAGAITTDLMDGYLFVSQASGMTTFKIDLTTGVPTQVGSPVPSGGATVLTFVP